MPSRKLSIASLIIAKDTKIRLPFSIFRKPFTILRSTFTRLRLPFTILRLPFTIIALSFQYIPHTFYYIAPAFYYIAPSFQYVPIAMFNDAIAIIAVFHRLNPRYPEKEFSSSRTQQSMVGSLEQITQRLAALDEKAGVLKETFQVAYTSYLESLGQSVKQQIIQSSYHICTEVYPQRFLALSVGQRQQFQDDLKDLAQQAYVDIANLMKSIDPNADDELLELDDELEIDDELEALLQELPGSDEQDPPTPIEELTQWQANLERSIVKTLQSTSQVANRFLQHADILPKRVPSPVLEAVAKVGGGDGIAGTPSLLNLLVEARERAESEDEDEDEDEDETPRQIVAASLMRIIAINLRLAEIEFNDPTVMSGRNKLREHKKQLQTLAREYQKKQKEQSIAQARLAWKSTWTNE